MFEGLKPEEQNFLQSLQDDKLKMQVEMANLQAVIKQMSGATGKGGDWHQGKGAREEGGKGGHGRVVLDEKYFRRCDKFDGTPAKFKSWVFDLITAVGSVDQSLAGDLRGLLKANCTP